MGFGVRWHGNHREWHVQLQVPFPGELKAPSLRGATDAVDEMLIMRPGSRLSESFARSSESLMSDIRMEV